MESILTSIKKLLGITEDYEHFDPDIVMHINSVFSILTQLGVGPKNGFSIADKSSVWTDFMPKSPLFESVKSYIFLRVKILFDPPLSTAVSESIKHMIDELEWRLNTAAEFGEVEDETEDANTDSNSEENSDGESGTDTNESGNDNEPVDLDGDVDDDF